jgi:hypothetical protein
MIISEGTDAHLICLDGANSEVRNLENMPMVVDGNYFNDCILSIGLDEENAIGNMAFSVLETDKMANLYPNPIYLNDILHLSYVLIDPSQEGELAVYDLRGKKMYSQAIDPSLLHAGMNHLSFHLNNLSSGLYIAAIHIADKIIAEKFTYIK